MPGPQIMDLTGHVYGQLEVIAFAGRWKGNTYWKCRCLACGSVRTYLAGNLRSGASTQCQHCPAKQRVRRWDAPGYLAWKRITKSGQACKRWRTFEAFISDMGPPPKNKRYLVRFDPTKPYTPSNCCWSEQARVRFLRHKGRTMPLVDWAKELGLSKGGLYRRLKVMPLSKALTMPPQKPGSD